MPQDILVNNATQTIRRPAAYYRHLLPAEAAGAPLLESSSSAADSAGVMLKAHYELHSNRSSSSNEAILDLPSSTDVEHYPATASQALEAPGRELASGSRSDPNSSACRWDNLTRVFCCDSTAGFGSPELLSRSAVLSQVALLPEDAPNSSVVESLPAEVYDINGQQLDRAQSSNWPSYIYHIYIIYIYIHFLSTY